MRYIKEDFMIRTIAKKSFIQVKRDRIMLLLTLLCAPFFIFLYKLIFIEGMTVYKILINPRTKSELFLAEEFINNLKIKKYPGGGKLFNLELIDNYEEGISILKNRDARILVKINSLENISIIGDYSDPYYTLGSILIQNQINDFIIKKTGYQLPFKINQEPLGTSLKKTEFENYVPGIIIFSVLIQLYLFTILLVKEKESGVFLRYRLCGISSFSYIIGHTVIFSGIAFISLIITVITAFLLGFKSTESLISDFIIVVIVCFILNWGVVGISFIISGFTKNSLHGLLVTTFPFMVLVFFSGSVYPFPKIIVGNILGRDIGIFDILPSTHAVNILHKVLTFGTNITTLKYDLIGLLLISLFLLYLGVIKVGSKLKEINTIQEY